MDITLIATFITHSTSLLQHITPTLYGENKRYIAKT